MQRLFKNLKYTILLAVLIWSACKIEGGFPEIPVISNPSISLVKNQEGVDSIGKLKFSFTDGDANIGLSQRDTVPPFDLNLFIDYYELIEGAYKKVTVPNPNGTVDTINFNGRIPLLNENGTTVDLQGEITQTINVLFAASDSIKLEFYIKDRSLNKSNKLTLAPIVLTK
ncbi:MAG: hypothetical protein ACI81S_001458 [Sphingobacteriales bacterium]|jgi:hypothetical protein